MRMEVLVGMIASGKSTYARKRADEGALVISHDDLTEMLHARYRYEQELRSVYRKIEEDIAWNILGTGRDLVIDRTHLTRESRQRWVKWRDNSALFRSFETLKIIAVVFAVEAPEVHARRRYESDHRGRAFPAWEDVAQRHYSDAKAEPLSDDEGFDEIIRMGIDIYGSTPFVVDRRTVRPRP